MIVPPIDPNTESHNVDKPPLRDDTRFAAGRIAVFQYCAVVIFLFLISGFWRLQVQNPEFYGERAQQNSIKSVPIPGPRGRILDRDGRVIVENHSSFRLILAREQLKEEHLRPIAQGLDLDYTDLAAKVQRMRRQSKWVPITLKDELTPGDIAFVESHHDFFPELVMIQAQPRLYPQSGMLAHVIGYTGEVSEQELDMPEFAKYNPGDIVGKFGLEKQYNETLMGVDGQRQVVVDNLGRVRQTIGIKPAVPGHDLQTTIDLDLQAVAELAMDGPNKELHVDHKNGAVVALDPRNGEVLAMVSRPTFDPNKFTGRIKAKDWKEINDNPDHPLMNKAIQAQQAPGSTFKPIVALTGLETGTVDEHWSVHCSGGVALYGKYQHCWEKRGHGTQSMHGGIVHSCDVYFYTLGAKIGIDKLSQYGEIVGFGRKTGIDLPHEAEGVLPSEKWKLRNFRTKWYAGETPSVAIGQGALTVTPLQLARAEGGMAVGGKWYQPHMVKLAPDQLKYDEWALNPDNVKIVKDGMYGVVNEGGTGVRAALPHIDLCGKTGTAQLASYDYMKASGKAKELRENAWFVGFAPRDNPEIVVVALFEHGEHGQYAAAIVRDVIKAYFDKKARLEAMRQEQNKLAGAFSLGLPQQQGPGTGGRGQGSGVGGPGSGSQVDTKAVTASVPVAVIGSEAPAQANPSPKAAAPRNPTPDPRPPF
ncbi:MAG TPA: penicillin-binding protein 2 [Candidatus Acidoferrales bacterium]|nr:penicillin-binding protein 2 [Candidatus Acidoferrales bacterium]